MQATTITQTTLLNPPQLNPIEEKPQDLRIASTMEEVASVIEDILGISQNLPHSENAKNWFVDWKKQFFQMYNLDVILERKERKKAARALCYLIHYGIEQMICNHTLSKSEQIAYLKPRCKVLRILEKIVPNSSAELFLKYQKREAEKLFLVERDHIKRLVRRMRKQFFKEANAVNKKWSKRFKRCKEGVLKAQKASELQSVYKRLDSLNKKVCKVLQKSKRNLSGVSKLMERMKVQEDKLTQNFCILEKKIKV